MGVSVGIFLSWFRVVSTYCFYDPQPLFFFSRFRVEQFPPHARTFSWHYPGPDWGPEQVFNPPGLSLGPGWLPSLPFQRLLGFSSFFLPFNASLELCPLCTRGLYHTLPGPLFGPIFCARIFWKSLDSAFPLEGLLQLHAHTPICYICRDGRAAMPSSQGDCHTLRAADPVSLCSRGQDWCGRLCPSTLLVQPSTGSSRRTPSGSPGPVWGGWAHSAEGPGSWMNLNRASALGWVVGLLSENLPSGNMESCLSREPSA